MQNKQINIKKIYQDKNILIVFKPAHLTSCDDKNNHDLISYLKNDFNYIEPIHRLDTNTTGLLICSINKEITNDLINLLKNNHIKKFYKALIYHHPKNKKAVLNAYLVKNKNASLVQIYNHPITKDAKKLLLNIKL